MNFSHWFNIEENDWPFGEDLKVFADVAMSGGSVKVGQIKVMFRGLVDVTKALGDYEIRKLETKIADAYLAERSEVGA